MSDKETKTEQRLPAQEPDHTPPPADPSQVLSPKRRSALVSYLAVLFAVAFLFVAITMGLEARRLKSDNQELQDTNKKNSATLTGSINALQEENQKLQEELDQIKQENGTMLAELAQQQLELDQQKQNAQTQFEEAAAEQERLNQELSTLREELEAARQEAQDAVRVSELLHQALAADERGDMKTLEELLAQIEPLKQLLSETEQELYEELKIA